jgi:hypothetical protein
MGEGRAIADYVIFSCFVPEVEGMIVIIKNNYWNSLPGRTYEMLESETFLEPS